MSLQSSANARQTSHGSEATTVECAVSILLLAQKQIPAFCTGIFFVVVAAGDRSHEKAQCLLFQQHQSNESTFGAFASPDTESDVMKFLAALRLYQVTVGLSLLCESKSSGRVALHTVGMFSKS